MIVWYWGLIWSTTAWSYMGGASAAARSRAADAARYGHAIFITLSAGYGIFDFTGKCHIFWSQRVWGRTADDYHPIVSQWTAAAVSPSCHPLF